MRNRPAERPDRRPQININSRVAVTLSSRCPRPVFVQITCRAMIEAWARGAPLDAVRRESRLNACARENRCDRAARFSHARRENSVTNCPAACRIVAETVQRKREVSMSLGSLEPGAQRRDGPVHVNVAQPHERRNRRGDCNARGTLRLDGSRSPAGPPIVTH
jgi:hypothetical protein